MEEQGLALSPEQRLAYGVKMERMGKYKGAEEQYKKVLEAGTHDEEAWFNLGNIYVKRAEDALFSGKWYKKAEECYHKVLDLNNHNTAAINNLADLYNRKGDYQRALELVQPIARQNVPDSHYFFTTLGDTYMNLEQYDKAIDSYKTAEEEAANLEKVDKTFYEALYNNMADVYNKIGNKDLSEQYRNRVPEYTNTPDESHESSKTK
jgi:tetratricopeptide (TPR) repeat protein